MIQLLGIADGSTKKFKLAFYWKFNKVFPPQVGE
jgi:hypothetical protein